MQRGAGQRVERYLKESLGDVKPIRVTQINGIQAFAEEDVQPLARQAPMTRCLWKAPKKTGRCKVEFPSELALLGHAKLTQIKRSKKWPSGAGNAPAAAPSHARRAKRGPRGAHLQGCENLGG
jgi:hypothetical protein